jgi:hypothetical protein
MKNLEKLCQECMEELNAIGIKYGNIKEFKVNSRAKSRWGLCSKENGTYTIEISNDLLADNIKDDKVKNVIIHEILHTCDNCMSHTGEWKRLAGIVNDCYACYNIKRGETEEEVGCIRVHKARKENYTYAVICNKCGQVIYKSRMCGIIKYPHEYHHVNCGGHFERL